MPANQTVKRQECLLFLRLQIWLIPQQCSVNKEHLRSQDLNICTFFQLILSQERFTLEYQILE